MGDCVVIASTDELMDAIEQFKDNLVLRVTTDVKRKKSRPFTPPDSPRLGSRRAEDMRPTEDAKQVPAQIQNVLESFVTAVGTAVLTLQSHVNNNNNNGTQYVRTSETAAAAAPSDRTDATVSSTAEEEQAAKECVENMEMPKEEIKNEEQAQAP